MVRLHFLAAAVAPALAAPKYHGCLDNVSQSLPYCDTSLSHEARAQDILGRLSIDEKVNLLSPHDAPAYCGCTTAPVPRIGLPDWHWLTEANTNAGFCSANGTKCSTVFVGPLNFGASFNRSLWYLKGDVISTELRVHNNNGDHGDADEIALSGFGPNINLLKDPRYGRNSELVGEDPFLAGSYAVSYLKGMQQVSKQGHLKMLAYVKHYTAYSKEAGRMDWQANVSMFDFFDSYLPQYQMAFQEGEASGAMCSYFAPNGVPSCGNHWLLTELVREQWSRPDAVFMSDCSAVANFLKNGYAINQSDASAKALNAGLDIYGGWHDKYWTDGYLHQAIDEGLTDEATLDQAVLRTLMQKLKVGVFDPLEGQDWVKLGSESLNSSYAQQLAFEAGLQGMVLLKNDRGALPLKRGVKLAVVGPLALETVNLKSDYAHWGPPYDPPSIAEAFSSANTGGATTVVGGVEVNSQNTSGIDEALAAVQAADVTVLVLGDTHDQEHEGKDRGDTKLPGLQHDFGLQVLAASKGPVVLVLCNGGMVSIDALLGADAIVESFSPLDHGTHALAASLFGANHWGKLPYTIYPENYTQELDAADAGISDYEMAKGPGRSYRYYSGEPLFRFGFGLSYTSFSLDCSKVADLSVNCTVTNTGAVAGDEVVLAYHRVGDDLRKELSSKHPVPLQQLVDFDRVSLQPGESRQLRFDVAQSALALTTEDGSKVVYPGRHQLLFSTGQQPIVVDVDVQPVVV